MSVVKYWMVHHDSSSTNVQHKTIESAEKEATRLAAKSPGTVYTVLEVVKAFRTVISPVTEVEVLEDKSQETL